MDIEKGDPRSLLLGFVEKYKIEVLFLGSRGLSGAVGCASLPLPYISPIFLQILMVCCYVSFLRFLVGSTSQYAMHNCPCSVFIVK